MNENIPPALMSAPPPAKKRSGCLFYGCLTCAILALLLVVGIGLGIRYAVSNLIETYTDTSPMVLPTVEMPQEELDRLRSRIGQFNQALQMHSNAPALVLTARDINALIANSPEAKRMDLTGHFYIALDGDRASGQVSLPLDKFKIPTIKTKGRYLNGVGTFTAGITNAVLGVYLQSLEVKGKPMPENFMSGFRGQNFAEEINNDPKKTEMLGRIESMEIKDSTVIIKAKQK